MAHIEIDPPAIAKAGDAFRRKAGEFNQDVDAFLAAAMIPASAAGPIGPGEDALKAYEQLFAQVSMHLHNLQEAVDETGVRLSKSASNYEIMERENTLPRL